MMRNKADPLLALAVGFVALGILLAYRPWDQPAQGDIALFQVFGRLIANGAVPYDDFFDHKTPLASYINAGASLVASWFDLDYVLTARAVSLALFSIGAALLYLVARSAGLGRGSAFAAGVLFVAVDFFAWTAAAGFEPKALMSVFGLGALAAAYHRRWRPAGALAALAALTWQPAGVFLFGAGVAVLRVPRSERLRALAAVFAGAAAVTVVFVAYLLISGTFDSFWDDTVTFNRSYVGGPDWPPAFGRATEVTLLSYNEDRWLLLLGGAAFLAWLLVTAIDAARRRTFDAGPALPVAAVTAAVCGYSAVNFSGIGDILPFAPLVAFWSAWAVDWLAKRLRYEAVAAGAMALLLLGYGHYTLIARTNLQDPAPSLSDQRDDIRDLVAAAGVRDGERIYVVNLAAFTLLAEREHAGEFHYLWSGVPAFAIERDGFDVFSNPIQDQHPKLVVIGRGAEPVVRGSILETYRRVRPNSLPIHLRMRAEIWVRNDVAEVAPINVEPPRPQFAAGVPCRATDFGPSYLPTGPVSTQQLRRTEGLGRVGFVEARSVTFAAPGEPTATCSMSFSTLADVSRQWMSFASANPCDGCEHVQELSDLAAGTLVTVGAVGIDREYGARLLISRPYALLNVTVLATGDTPDDRDALLAMVTEAGMLATARLP